MRDEVKWTFSEVEQWGGTWVAVVKPQSFHAKAKPESPATVAKPQHLLPGTPPATLLHLSCERETKRVQASFNDNNVDDSVYINHVHNAIMTE